MDNAARVDELWAPSALDPGAAPHLESSRWLADVIRTSPGVKRPCPEPIEIPVLGHTILWTPDRDRPFPEPVIDAFARLQVFSELAPGWDSHGGRPLQREAAGIALRLVLFVHQRGHQARLVPLPSGGVGFRFEHEKAVLEIDVDGSASVEALLEEEGAEDVIIGPEADITEAEKLLDRFLTAR